MSACVTFTVFDFELIDSRPGYIQARVTGLKADSVFQHEAGGHRYQRIPPTEKRGRIHTSTVTVAVLPEPTEVQMHIPPQDIEWSTCRGSGAGGQHRNKTESAVVAKHVPTGLMVRVESERSQHQNRATALALLRVQLWDAKQATQNQARSDMRKQQVGSGMRGDKRRTIRFQDETVVDHVLNRTWRLRDYLKGIR